MKTLPFFSAAFLILNNCCGQTFVNPSVEMWASATICETNLSPDGWSNYSNVGLGPDEGNLSLCPSTIPPVAADGNIYARCLAGNPNTGEGMYQNVTGFAVGNVYTILYQFCGSNRWGGSGDCWWHLFIDDVDVNQSAVFSSGDPVWKTNSFVFTATTVTHKFGFRAYTPTYNGGGSAAIDNFVIVRGEVTGIPETASAQPVSFYPNPFHLTSTFQLNAEIKNAELRIINALGEIMKVQKITTSSVVISREGLPNGIYFYQVTLDNGKAVTGKLMIE